ncbi:MAG: (2Fe-2S)-binding protein [Hoeflea sp.]|uniref:(2Fe-2S)-binding protein n=1 Tax=Hoeflea sp. TaxID=1940281 RepID=UPI001D209C89|nr:2Fe-2S iron-sulfur cluster-binding protein [Hoeflea sp.]MBU4528994.1 (2Fe-2S)-binding protein [Alphaproteobacteria bacterium]MBU4543399.1 (2Fe-2S)-binding protein [Alphaproteobacteria bacterium]MBU4549024.1 (2Fe-2S)-binding protein [Alphaproteobacteria bacterium]MBV1725159.1 (2Fe-2S)-binding protein [Hoeflea sp.]MBV1785120.1 (2Fe-2S)-binding protein [Hoeflea sp.]
MQKFNLTVNGAPREVEAGKNNALLYVLRNELGMKGVRYGCGIGECGACSVILDGERIFSCDTPIWAAEGKSIVTIEGMAEGDRLHPLQEAFLREQAAQCGYCINGIMVTAKALLDKTPEATDEQILEALDRNLCRCGAHVRIIRAIRSAAEAMRSEART